MTAKNQTEDLLKGFKSGGNDYIKKPFSIEELIVRVNNLISLMKSKETQLPENTKTNLGQYIFYPLKYELHFENEVQKLSHREAQLLLIFANQKNGAIDRKEILMKVWGDDSFFNSRNLDVYIKKLRGYLKKDEKVQIITLKGVGYHFMS